MALSLDVSNSERSQQHGADERKRGEGRQDIEPQGDVHVSASLMLMPNFAETARSPTGITCRAAAGSRPAKKKLHGQLRA
jgi:hypothetical protein